MLNNNCAFANNLSQPKTFRVNEFTPEALHAFQKSVATAISMGQPILPLYIESCGGDAHVLGGFMSTMEHGRENGVQFAGIVSGAAQSAGAVVFLYCDYRFMGSNGILMFHNLQMGLQGKAPDVHAEVNWWTLLEGSMFEKLSKWIKKPKGYLLNQLKKRFNSDWNINAAEAMELKLIEKVGVPIPALELNPHWSLRL